MVQALLIRQCIRAADYVLLAALGVVAYQGIVSFMGLDRNDVHSSANPAPPNVDIQVALVKPIEEYRPIIESGMFGPAGDMGKDEIEEAPPEVVDTDKETDLPLRLEGAAATVGWPDDPSASAYIVNAAAQTVKKDATYWVNDEIMAGVRLLEVYPRYVKIINNNQIETLTVVKDTPPANGGDMRARMMANNASRAANIPNRNVRDAKMVSLPKDETYEEMMSMDYADTIRQLRPQMKYDDNNNVVGITSDYFEDIPLAQKTGFVNGDVITEVNGTPIDSQEAVPDILIKEQNATSVRIRFERNGRSMVRTIRLE